jgi:hypothetical protein
MFEQVGNEHYGVPLEALLPLLTDSYEIYELLCREFGSDRVDELYDLMDEGSLEGELGTELRAVLMREILEESGVEWAGTMTDMGQASPFEVKGYQGIYIVLASANRELGCFLSLEDARAYLAFHWAPVRERPGFEGWDDGDDIRSEQENAHQYIEEIRRRRRHFR